MAESAAQAGMSASAAALGSTDSAKPDSGGAAGNIDGSEQNISYSAERIIGNGSFGVVFEAKVVETGEVVAIKKVLQDKRFKNRELQIMRQLVKDPHPNIVALRHCFYSQVRQQLALAVSMIESPELSFSLNLHAAHVCFCRVRSRMNCI